MNPNTFRIATDIKTEKYVEEITIRQQDTILFIVTVTDNGAKMALDNVGRAELAHVRPDKKVVITPGSIQSDGTIHFLLDETEATAKEGVVKATVQLYDAASNDRISDLGFSYKVKRDPNSFHVADAKDRTLIQAALEDGPINIAEAKAAAVIARTVSEQTETVRIATEAERQAAKGIREGMEAERLATVEVRNNTEAERVLTEKVRKATEAERIGYTEAKGAADTAASAASDAAHRANGAADRADLSAGKANQAAEIADAVRLAADEVRKQTLTVKENTETALAETKKATGEAKTATEAADLATRESKEVTTESRTVANQSRQALDVFDLERVQRIGRFDEDAAATLQGFREERTAHVKKFTEDTTAALEGFEHASNSALYEVVRATTDADEATAGTQGAIAYATQQGDYAKGIAESIKTKWLAPVATFAELATKYPTPGEGDTVNVTGEARIYRYSSGAWIITDQYNASAIGEIASKVNETARQTQLLQNGVNVLNADVATPVDFEIQGRTQTSLANSNLEQLKYYALADKKTKIIVDNTTIAGIGKFQKKSTTLTTADYVGKVSGSTTANPHSFKGVNYAGLRSPSEITFEYAATALDRLKALDGAVITDKTFGAGLIHQQLFSFNIVEQIERQLGLIPKTSLADKVAWVKENVNRLTANWHGFGSGPAGNKANLVVWVSNVNAWNSTALVHSSNAVGRLSFTRNTDMQNYTDANGFAHFLAYAEPSDGVTASTINTDFINLEIELKATAQLNTRGKIIRVENFEGKVSGSTVENPHIQKHNHSTSGTGLIIPSNFPTESSTEGYALTRTIDNVAHAITTNHNGASAQRLFSFNLIEAIERNVGKIPASDTAGKVAWIKANVARIQFYWNGFGSSVSGNKATIGMFRADTSVWWTPISHTSSSVTKITIASTNFSTNLITAASGFVHLDGFTHFLAYAEPSDGATASTINTDYVELEIELKPDANFSNPKVPLYEVTKEEFDKIGITWSDEETLKRFPIVEGTQHLLNPYVMAEGENLLPPFTEWTLHANARIVSPYELELVATGSFQRTTLRIRALPQQTYNFSIEGNGRILVQPIGESGTGNLGTSGIARNGTYQTYTTPAGTHFLDILIDNESVTAGTFAFKNPILSLGTTAKPFTPRNPSYLYAETKLGAIGNAKDVLFRQDGQWKRRKVVERVDLSNSVKFISSSGYDYSGFKVIRADSTTSGFSYTPAIFNATKFDGKNIKSASAYTETFTAADIIGLITGFIYLSVSDADSGWGETYIPNASDIIRYLNGWKYTDGTTWTSVTGNGQTAIAQQALDTKPTDYTPYKLSYVLATPITENVRVEGDIVADGLTQLETGAGVIVREKVTPKSADGRYYINLINYGAGTSPLKNKVANFVEFYKNGESMKGLYSVIVSTFSNGKFAISFPASEFDATAEYTVTYQILDKPKLTSNPVDVKAVFARNIRSAVDDLAGRASDNTTRLSIHERAILDFYIKLKALEAK